jgi:hypothetical protein
MSLKTIDLLELLKAAEKRFPSCEKKLKRTAKPLWKWRPRRLHWKNRLFFYIRKSVTLRIC